MTALYSRKALARVGLSSLLALAVAPLWAQDNPANTVVVSPADGVPVESVAPAVSPAAGRLIYKSVDSKGMVTFTDTAPIGRPSEAIVVQTANTMPTGLSQGEPVAPREKKVPVNYVVTITSPANDVLFGQETEAVDIAATVTPELKDGSTFQLYYDGKPVADGGMSYTVTTMDRGTHTVEAKVFDKKKKLLVAADKVQFHIRRITKLLPQQPDGPIKDTKSGTDNGSTGDNGSGNASGADHANDVKGPSGASGTKGAGGTNGANGSLGAGSPNTPKSGGLGSRSR